MQSSGAQEMRDASENIGGILDDVWRLTAFPYSQDRMKHMMDVIGMSDNRCNSNFPPIIKIHACHNSILGAISTYMMKTLIF